MRTSSRGRRSRRILVLLCLAMVGELMGATRVVEPSRLSSLPSLSSLSSLPPLSSLSSSLSSLTSPTSLLSLASFQTLSITRTQARADAYQRSDRLNRLERRLDRVEAEGRGILAYHAEQVEPLVSLLEPRIRDHEEVLPRVALALVREGHHVGVDPRLLGGVLLIENPWLDPAIRSPVGAVGIMQVMPFHAGGWGCDGADLTHIETNVCHGTRILAEALRSTQGDLHAALLLYNGCRNGTNTPDCHDYPDRVQAQLGRSDAGGEVGR